MPIPDVCADTFDPVCGCDGVTYGNAREAAANLSRRRRVRICMLPLALRQGLNYLESMAPPPAHWLALFVALSVAWTSVAFARPPSCEKVERFTLPNGVQVTLLVDARLSNVALVSSVHAGSRHDPPGYTGLAHFVAHLASLGKGQFPPAQALYDESGANDVGTELAFDTTAYRALVPSEALERALWIEARRLALGLDLLDARSASAVQALLARDCNCFDVRASHAIDEALFGRAHPYGLPRDAAADVQRLGLTEARWFFAEYYRPERVKLALVGAFEAATARRWIEKHWGSLEGRGAVSGTTPERDCGWSDRLEPSRGARLVVRQRRRKEVLDMFWAVDPSRGVEHEARVARILHKSLQDAAQELGLSKDVRFVLVERELARYWHLSIGLIFGKKFEALEPLFSSIASELRATPPDEQMLRATHQEFERSERLEDEAPIFRALQLVRPSCIPSACVEAQKRPTKDDFASLDLFDASRALIVEWRYDPAAPDEGSVERTR